MTNLQQDIVLLRELDDEALLHSLKRHVGSSNRLNALVLAHLAEVDARGAYRKWACETLAAYCIYELRLSEDEAQRRCRAARIMRQFPVLFEMVSDASIHLTGILLLAPYLTPENHQGVLARARYRRKREIERLVAELAPALDVPALVQPLGVVTGSHTVPGKGWAALTESTLGWVRQLDAGDGPTRAPSVPDAEHAALMRHIEATVDVETEPDGASDLDGAAQPRGTANPGIVPAQMRFKVQFTADQAYVDLLERARALLWHQLPNGDLIELQRLALEALVEKLQQRKCGALTRTKASNATASNISAPARNETSCPDPPTTAPARNPTSPPIPSHDPTATDPIPAPPSKSSTERPLSARSTSRNSRHIPRAARREVWQRDGGRCSFTDARGVRCRAVSAIEFHHEQPHARGGPATVNNLTLRCRAHNQLAAEQDFGRSFMQTWP